MKRSICALGLVLFLAACGGGGGPTLPTVDPGPTRSLTGLQSPTFSDASIVPTVNGILRQSDSMVVSDLVGKYRGNTYVAPTSCTQTTCVSALGAGYTLPWDVRDIRGRGIDPNLRYSGVGEKNGVYLAQAQGRTVFASFPSDVTSYGAWLDHNAFIVSLENLRSGTLGGLDLSNLEIAYGVSIGNDTGTRPTGSATWNGIMVGGTEINGPPQPIQGDATVTYDLGQNDLDVAFTGIYNLSTRTRFTDMRWSNLSVNADGSFRQKTASRDIEGRFYGPGHTEVGGVFTHPDAIGAFGAKKQ